MPTSVEISQIAENELGHLSYTAAYPFAYMSAITSIPADQVTLLFCLLSAIALGWLHRYVPTRILKHSSNIVTGFTISYLVTGIGSLNILSMSAIVYFFMSFILELITYQKKIRERTLDYISRVRLEHEKNQFSEQLQQDAVDLFQSISSSYNWVGHAVFVFAMGYMSISHIYRMYIDYMGYKVDFTAPLMIVTLKMVSYAWGCVDGLLIYYHHALFIAPLRHQAFLNSGSTAGDLTLIPSFSALLQNPLCKFAKEDAYRRERAIVREDLRRVLGYFNSSKRGENGQCIVFMPSFVTLPRTFIGSFFDIVQFFGWVYFFPGIIAGPMIEYNEYLSHIDGSLYLNRITTSLYDVSSTGDVKPLRLDTHFSNEALQLLQSSSAHAISKNAPIPFAIGPVFGKLLKALVLYGGVLIAQSFPIAGYVSTSDFYSDYPNPVFRFFYTALFTIFSHWKYYFVWTIAEAACVSSGIGLSRIHRDVYVRTRTRSTDQVVDANKKFSVAIEKVETTQEWDGCSNCYVIACEWPHSVSAFANAWNVRVSAWLKHTIYFRIESVPKIFGKMRLSSFANIVTKMTSAFWHGFYPGYYFFFFQAWFVQEAEMVLRKLIQPTLEWYFPKTDLQIQAEKKAQEVETLQKENTPYILHLNEIDNFNGEEFIAEKNNRDQTQRIFYDNAKTTNVHQISSITVNSHDVLKYIHQLEVDSRCVSVISPFTKPPVYNMDKTVAKVFDFLMHIFILITTSYSGASFFLLEFGAVLELYADAWFFYHVSVLFGVFLLLPYVQKRRNVFKKRVIAGQSTDDSMTVFTIDAQTPKNHHPLSRKEK